MLAKLLAVLSGIREFKQITTAGATTAAVTEKVSGRVRLGGLLNTKKNGLRSLKFLLFSFSQPNSSAERTMAVVRLARTNRLFLSKSECHTLSTITT